MRPVDALTTETFSWKAAHTLARCSKLVYGNATEVEERARDELGFATCRFIERQSSKGNTQLFVASTGESLLICFRGTQELIDWLSNLKFAIPGTTNSGTVHRGFLDAYLLVREAIDEAISDLSVSERALFLTGHSLGGALATLAAESMLGRFQRFQVVTFGQPRLAGDGFVQGTLTILGDRLFRVVNDRDIVPTVPPGWDHVGLTRKLDADGNPTLSLETTDAVGAGAPGEDVAMTENEFEAFQKELAATPELASIARGEEVILEGFVSDLVQGIRDHLMDQYLTKVGRLARAS